MDVAVRVAEPLDRSTVAAIYRRASLSNSGDRPHLLANPEVLEFSPTALREGRTRVATTNGRVVGFVTTAATGEAVEVEDLFVDPDWFRRGVATELIQRVVTDAQADGRAYLAVTANPHALAFYRRVGFSDDGVADTRFGPAPRLRLDLGT